MNHRMVIKRILTITALAILATGLASADMIITTDAATVGPTSTDFDFTLIFGATATPAGFHLVSATLMISDAIDDPVLALTNKSTSTQHFSFTSTSEADITSNSVDGTFVGSSTVPTTVLSTGVLTYAPGETKDFAPASLSSSLGPAAVSNAAGYLGGASIGGFTLSGTTVSGGGNNLTVNQTQTSTINGELVFDFAPNTSTVPEPATVGLFGGVLLALGSFLKKNRQAAKRS